MIDIFLLLMTVGAILLLVALYLDIKDNWDRTQAQKKHRTKMYNDRYKK